MGWVVERQFLEHVLLADVPNLVHVLHKERRACALHAGTPELPQIERFLVVLHHVQDRCENEANKADQADQKGCEKEPVCKGFIAIEELLVFDRSCHVNADYR